MSYRPTSARSFRGRSRPKSSKVAATATSIWLDFREVPEELWEADLPSRYNLRCLIRGFDWKNKPIRISPGALTHLGGIAIDRWGRTNVHRLYAVGEATAPLHGSRRRGGNAFSECVVFGARAGRAAAELARDDAHAPPPVDRAVVEERIAQIASWRRPANPEGDPAALRRRIQATMWRNAGPLRTDERLARCLADLAEVREQLRALHAGTPFEIKAAVEVEYMLDVSEMITRCAQFRTESRGAHFRADFPDLDNENWLCQSVCRRGAPPQRRALDVTRLPLPRSAPAQRRVRRPRETAEGRGRTAIS